MVSPQQSKPSEGFFKFNIEFTSLIHQSEQYSMTFALQEMRIDLIRMVDKILKQSRTIDREGLCIVTGKLAWNISVDICLLNEDGNLVDACFLITVLALMNTQLPEVLITKDRIKINHEKLRSLNVHHTPVCVTFYYLEGLNQPIIDANSKEEKLSIARLSIIMNVFGDLCGMNTFGCLEVDAKEIKKRTEKALEETKRITNVIRGRWKEKGNFSGLLDFRIGLN